jgi:uncharacterized protein YegL
MPLVGDDDLENFKIPNSHYGFSAAKIGDLQATEYTLATVVFDESGSTAGFAGDMEKATQEIVKSCRHSPRADNLMLRTVVFGTNMSEFHGFKLLESCNVADYAGFYGKSGNGASTALFDSAHNAIKASNAYAKQLSQNDFLCNGIVFVITDGDDNASLLTAVNVGEALREAVQSEAMESLVAILIGVNVNTPHLHQYLTDFAKKAGFTPVKVKDASGKETEVPYLNLTDASEKTLAKLAKFVSQSISSQSQALGTKGPSQSLVF